MISQERKKILRNRIKELRNVRSAALEEIKEIQEQLKTRIDEGVDYGDYLKNYTEEKENGKEHKN